MDNLGAITWEVVFGEAFDSPPDPNDPANEARINADRVARQKKFKAFAEGPGKPFFEHMKYGMRRKLFNLVVHAEIDCNCELANQIREMRIHLQLLAQAEMLSKQPG